MGGYICERCNKLRHKDDHGYHSAVPVGKTYADVVAFCFDCFPDVLEAVRNGELVYAEIDCKDMTRHRVTDELEVQPIEPPPR